MKKISTHHVLIGPGFSTIHASLRVIRRKSGRQLTPVVLDWRGRGAMLLEPKDVDDFIANRGLWVDLGSRLKPQAISGITAIGAKSDLFRPCLTAIGRAASRQFWSKEIEWTAPLVQRMAEKYPVNLASFHRYILRPENRGWLVAHDRASVGQIDLVDRALRWAFGFGIVQAVTSSISEVDLFEALTSRRPVWFEMPFEHLEAAERVIVSAIVMASLIDALLRMQRINSKDQQVVVLHLNPERQAFAIAGMISRLSALARHMVVLSPAQGGFLNKYELEWLDLSPETWLVGSGGDYQAKKCNAWLPKQMLKTANDLRGDQILVGRSHWSECIVTGTRKRSFWVQPVHTARLESFRRRKPNTVRRLAHDPNHFTSQTKEQQSFFVKLSDPEVLRRGWLRVQKSKGRTTGVDGVTPALFRTNLDKELRKLADEVGRGAYKARPLKRVTIGKLDGGKRFLGIGCIRDRVLQGACLDLIEPVFEPHFSPMSFAFRPRRGAHDAVALVSGRLRGGNMAFASADIRRCFDTIDHGYLLELLSRRIFDQEMLGLIRHWLKVDVLHFSELAPTEVGVPQGESLSPLLSNVYLDPLDHFLDASGIRFCRYADDIVILGQNFEAVSKAIEKVALFLESPLRMTLKAAKTEMGEAQDGIPFLGFRIKPNDLSILNKVMKRASTRIKDRVEALAKEQNKPLELGRAFEKLNSSIRGFRNYYRHAESGMTIHRQLQFLDGQLEQLAQKLLARRVIDSASWLTRERYDRDEDTERRSLAPGEYPEEPAVSLVPPITTETNKSPEPAIVAADQLRNGAQTDKSGILLIEKRLYILTHGAYLQEKDHHIVVKRKGRELGQWLIQDLEIVVIHGFGISLSTRLAAYLAEHRVVGVLLPTEGNEISVLNPVTQSRAPRRAAQVLRRWEPCVVSAGVKMIGAKIANQASNLRYFGKHRKKVDRDLYGRLVEAACEIRELSGRLRRIESSPGEDFRLTVMGIEGRAASVYWSQVQRMVPPDLGFTHRHTYGARDPMNQCLNYVYGMLYSEVWRAVTVAGMDPYFGVIHGSKRDQGSLVFDLIEEFRAPFCDRVVIALLARRFHPELGRSGHLRTSTRRSLAAAFHKRWNKPLAWRGQKLAPRRILEVQAQTLARLFDGKSTNYDAFLMAW